MELKTPILIVNFKTYEEGTGKNALSLAKICDEVAKETGKAIAVAVQPTDLKVIADSVQIPVLAQHVDGVGYGSSTGHIVAEAVKEAGGVGSLLNHSEDRYEKDALEAASNRLAELGMARVICADTPQKASEVAGLKPEFVAIEPPELIGTLVSVSSVKPEVITETVAKIKDVSTDVVVLCGAGVASKEDAKTAISLGANGILIATAVVKAENQKDILLELVSEL